MRTPSTSRWIALATVVGLAVTACSGSGGDASEVVSEQRTTVSYGGVQEQGASGYAAAVIQGYFEREGLEFSPTWATSGSAILQGVVGGEFQVANLGPAQLFAAIKNGACARVLRPTSGAAYGLIVQPKLHLNSALPYPAVLKQLKGMTIGIPARGAAQELVLRTLLNDAGLDPESDVTWIAIGAGPTATAAFSSDRVDVAMSVSQFEVNLQDNGTGFQKLLDMSGPDSVLGTFWQALAVANCDWADHHRDTVMKFCRALNRGFEALAKDPEVGPKAFAYVKIGSDPARSTALWEKYKNPVVQMPVLNEQNWASQSRFVPGEFVPSFSDHVVTGCSTA